MDYRLIKIYESMLRGETSSQQSPTSLSNLYEMARPAMPKEPKPPKEPKLLKPTPPEVSYNEVIAKYIGNEDPIDNYVIPPGNKTIKIHNPEDLKKYQTLFPVTPPKAGKTLDDAGTKGSGNGEIALYWLLRKTYPSIKDNRDSGKPDLAVNQNGAEIGLEVKAYDSKRIGLGRFGDQHENRNVLSIVFGLKALLSSLNSEQSKRTPSLDTFNKEELTSAFNILSMFDKNEELRGIAQEFLPIKEIYRQIDIVKQKLGLDVEYTPERGAANMLAAFLMTKLSTKPGYGGYMVNVKHNGEIEYSKVPTEEQIRNIEPAIILNNVNANGAALLIRPDVLFPS